MKHLWCIMAVDWTTTVVTAIFQTSKQPIFIDKLVPKPKTIPISFKKFYFINIDVLQKKKSYP